MIRTAATATRRGAAANQLSDKTGIVTRKGFVDARKSPGFRQRNFPSTVPASHRWSVRMSYIIAKVVESIGTITLDDERHRNALSKPLVEEVIAALGSFREGRVRVAILRAKQGARVFSAGHDVFELPESRRDPLGWDDPLRQLVREIENFPAPVIAMVEGSVWGGATETVFACDLVIATETATFAVTPAKLGVPYNVGGMLT